MNNAAIRLVKCSIAIAVISGLVATCPAKAEFFIDDWSLSVGCNNTFGFPSAFYSQPQDSPFVPAPLTVSVNNSMATGAYAFNWGLATGQFQIEGDLASEGGNGLPFCGTDNRIDFHITQDTLLSIDSEWSYQFNGGIRTSTIRFWVRNLDTGEYVLIRGDVGDTVAGDPPTDTFHVGGSVILTPGNYFVRSLMDLSAVGGSPNSISTAHGFAEITLTTVPTPAAFGPMAFAALLLVRRRSRDRA